MANFIKENAYHMHLNQLSCRILFGSGSVDFKINGKKIQEKVVGLNKNKKCLGVQFNINNGTTNGKRKFKSYCLGDNDYYWLHSGIDNRFWILPEMKLFEKGYISDKDEIKIHKPLLFKSNSIWLKEYEYSYDKDNRDKIIGLFR